MARGFWNKVGEIVCTTQDFEGQRLAEHVYIVLISTCCLLGFVLSCITRQFMYTGYAALFSTILSIILVLPPWPWYNKHPVSWSSGSKKKN